MWPHFEKAEERRGIWWSSGTVQNWQRSGKVNSKRAKTTEYSVLLVRVGDYYICLVCEAGSWHKRVLAEGCIAKASLTESASPRSNQAREQVSGDVIVFHFFVALFSASNKLYYWYSCSMEKHSTPGILYCAFPWCWRIAMRTSSYPVRFINDMWDTTSEIRVNSSTFSKYTSGHLGSELLRTTYTATWFQDTP